VEVKGLTCRRRDTRAGLGRPTWREKAAIRRKSSWRLEESSSGVEAAAGLAGLDFLAAFGWIGKGV